MYVHSFQNTVVQETLVNPPRDKFTLKKIEQIIPFNMQPFKSIYAENSWEMKSFWQNE